VNTSEKASKSNISWHPKRPYDALPDLPPLADLESKPILKAAIAARAALATLDASTELIPNPFILLNTIPLLEAQASSEIENIVTTTDALFRYSQVDDDTADPATKEALRYRGALRDGVQSISERPLATATAEMVCSQIKGADMRIRRVPGIAIVNSSRAETVYTPPEGETLIREKLANWERFLHQATDIDPVVRMAVLHYQFEAIHPFADGNGRTGRILNLLILIDQGLLRAPILYLSRHIIRKKAEYYQRLQSVTSHGEWEEWILFMLEAVTSTATWTTAKIHAIRALQESTRARILAGAPKIYSRDLLDVIFTQPYCRIQNVIDATRTARQTASAYLKQLSDIGVLNETKLGREKLFINPALMATLTSDSGA